jgi:crotonobetainyl-CoA:carnitine CoA-transferase CaiB-like acyl-CoA transferase
MAQLDVPLQARTASLTVAEAIQTASALGLAIADLPTMEAVLADEEFKKRQVWTQVPLADGRRGRTSLSSALVNGARR